jgi:hypothetical protein
MTMGTVFGVKAPEKPKDTTGQSLAQAVMSYLQKSGEGAMRGVRAANKALDVSQYVTPSTVAGFLPGAGFVQGAQDAQSAKQAFQAGNYGQAIGFGAQSVLNTGLEALPLTSALPAVSMMNKLPMDEASRMARAHKQGFETDLFGATPYYHGTGRSFDEFKLGADQTTFGASNDAAVYLTRDPSVADAYATATMSRQNMGGDWAPQVYPLAVRNENPLTLSADDYFALKRLSAGDTSGEGAAAWARLFPGEQPPSGDTFKSIKDKGFSSIGVQDGSEIAIFDPSAIRSRFAAFDPAKKNSRDLLASGVGLGLPAILAAQALRDEQK